MELNLGRVVGSIWYSGIGITGNSTTPTKYPDSGVTKALADDMYLNVTGNDRGNVYRCSTGGDADTAEWVYVGSILGASPDVIDNLESTATTKALSANQGKVLKDILDNAGLEPLVVTPTLGQATYTASLVIEDKTTTFTVTDMDDNTGTYSYTGQGGTTAIVNITIGTSIGLPQSGAIIKSIASSDARIKSYVLYDSASTEIFSETPSLWAHITDDEQNIIPSTNITDGANTYKSGIISKIIDGVRTALYPITHAKAVWFSKTRNETVYDKIGYMDDNIAPTEVSPSRNAYSAGDFLIYNNELHKVVAAIAVGESLTVGTNIEKKSTGAALSQLNTDLANNETAISSAAAWMVYENNKSDKYKYFVVSTNAADKWTYRGRGTTGRGNTDKVVVFARAGLEYSNYGFGICAIGTSAEAVTWANPTQYGDAIVTTFKTERGNTLYLAVNNGGWQGDANTTAYGSATIDGSTYELIPVAIPAATAQFQYNAFAKLVEDILVYDKAYTHLAQYAMSVYKAPYFYDYSNLETATDALEISFTANSSKNKTKKISKPDTACTHLPSQLDSQTTVLGLREVFWYSTTRVMVKITEFYPVQGRIWTNHYSNNAWSGWTTNVTELTNGLVARWTSGYMTLPSTSWWNFAYGAGLINQNSPQPKLLAGRALRVTIYCNVQCTSDATLTFAVSLKSTSPQDSDPWENTIASPGVARTEVMKVVDSSEAGLTQQVSASCVIRNVNTTPAGCLYYAKSSVANAIKINDIYALWEMIE